MATHDYVIANQSGAAFRTDLNNALAAIVSNNSNSSSPSTTYAYQWWADTSAGVLKIRNSANNAWIELLQLDGTLTLEDGSQSTPALAFRDDLDTGIFSSAANTFDIATSGQARVQVDPSGRVGINEASPSSFNSIADDLVITQATNHAGMTIRSGTSHQGNIAFQDAANTSFRGALTYDHNGDKMQLITDGDIRLTIDSSGRVMIGVTSTAHASANADDLCVGNNDSSSQHGITIGSNAEGSIRWADSASGSAGILNYRHSSDAMEMYTSGTLRQLIDSSGKTKFTQDSSGSTEPVLHLDRPNAASNAAVDMIHFDSGNQGRGKLVSASSDAGSPALASRSDYRIKENIRDYTDGWNIIKAVPVKLFDVKTDGSKDQKGWIAHELQEVLPDLVQGTKDAVDEDDNPIYQSVSMGLFMPDVISALQTAITKIETLEAKVAALEAA